MDIIDQIKERLSIFKNLYDAVRIVDPEKKKTNIVIDNKMEELSGTCYDFWKKSEFCENCISMRAYINNDTFVKVEYDREKVFLIIATPVEIDGKKFIAEILKDITQNGSSLHKLTKNSYYVEELISSMNEKAIRDDLTGLYNRKYINERLPMDIKDNKQDKLPLSIIMADIDFFKKVNDRYGHIYGDKILVDFSKLILKSINNDTEWACRFGGEEFIIVLSNSELKNAYTIAEKIRKQLENTTFNYGDININITASFGIYSITDYDINITDILSKVDKNLYRAKSKGRNRTIINQEDIENVDSLNINDQTARLSRLNKQINELREILGELCITLNSHEVNNETLFISQQLDELIVKYMKEISSSK